MDKRMVLLINPPNSNTVIDGQTLRVGNPAEHSDWSDYPASGILTLASALKSVPNIRPIYIDGVVFPFAEILDFITTHRNQICMIGISALTDTYEAGLKILEHARCENPSIVHVVGNDHFTALPELCLKNRTDLIDFGFVGNEVVSPFQQFVGSVVNGTAKSPSDFSGIMFQRSDGIIRIPQQPEPVFTDIDYSLLDEVFPHTSRYDYVFQNIFPEQIKKWFGRSINRGIAIEIARGCVKFRNDDACSFCSIQYGGMWKNSVSDAKTAWEVLYRAYRAGYDYFYVTADELALTFRQLLTEMWENRPCWFLQLSEDEKPVLTGYARTDGVMVEKNARLLYDLGFRVIMVGVDAGPKISLQAVNKPFSGSNAAIRVEHLYEANRKAFIQARNIGLRLRIGFVVGHVGMTKDLLKENIRYFCDLIGSNPDAVCTADIEILSPEPGSKEYRYLLDPLAALEKSRELGLQIADPGIRQGIADKWKERDVMVREELINDYVTAFMPELTLDDLIEARRQMRDFCRAKGVLIGEG